MEAFQLGFVVEGVEVAHTAAAEHLHDSLGTGAVVHSGHHGRGAQRTVTSQKPSQRNVTEAAHTAGEEVATVQQFGISGHKQTRWCSVAPKQHGATPVRGVFGEPFEILPRPGSDLGSASRVG